MRQCNSIFEYFTAHQTASLIQQVQLHSECKFIPKNKYIYFLIEVATTTKIKIMTYVGHYCKVAE